MIFFRKLHVFSTHLLMLLAYFFSSSLYLAHETASVDLHSAVDGQSVLKMYGENVTARKIRYSPSYDVGMGWNSMWNSFKIRHREMRNSICRWLHAINKLTCRAHTKSKTEHSDSCHEKKAASAAKHTQERKRWNDNAQTRPAPELRNVINLPVFASSPDLLIETSSRLSKKREKHEHWIQEPVSIWNVLPSLLRSVLCLYYHFDNWVAFLSLFQVRQT